MVLAAYEYVEERGSGSQSTSRPWPVTSSEWSGHGWTRCWSGRLPWRPLPPMHEATGAVASPLMPTRGRGMAHHNYLIGHNTSPDRNKPNPSPNRPHAAEPTRKALVTRESRLAARSLNEALNCVLDGVVLPIGVSGQRPRTRLAFSRSILGLTSSLMGRSVKPSSHRSGGR